MEIKNLGELTLPAMDPVLPESPIGKPVTKAVTVSVNLGKIAEEVSPKVPSTPIPHRKLPSIRLILAIIWANICQLDRWFVRSNGGAFAIVAVVIVAKSIGGLLIFNANVAILIAAGAWAVWTVRRREAFIESSAVSRSKFVFGLTGK